MDGVGCGINIIHWMSIVHLMHSIHWTAIVHLVNRIVWMHSGCDWLNGIIVMYIVHLVHCIDWMNSVHRLNGVTVSWVTVDRMAIVFGECFESFVDDWMDAFRFKGVRILCDDIVVWCQQC